MFGPKKRKLQKDERNFLTRTLDKTMPHGGLTIERVWIGNRIYWALTLPVTGTTLPLILPIIKSRPKSIAELKDSI
jgi:hypothetical protein